MIRVENLATLLMIVLFPLLVGCDFLPTKRTVVVGEFEGLTIGSGKYETFEWLHARGHTLVGAYLVNPARASRGSQLGVLVHAEAVVVNGGRGSEGVAVIDRLPESAGRGELAETVETILDIEQGLADSAAGRVSEHEAVLREF